MSGLLFKPNRKVIHMAENTCTTGGCSSSTGTCQAATPSKSAAQNGKGDAPRNMGPKYLKNFDQIDWGAHRRKKAR